MQLYKSLTKEGSKSEAISLFNLYSKNLQATNTLNFVTLWYIYICLQKVAICSLSLLLIKMIFSSFITYSLRTHFICSKAFFSFCVRKPTEKLQTVALVTVRRGVWVLMKASLGFFYLEFSIPVSMHTSDCGSAYSSS